MKKAIICLLLLFVATIILCVFLDSEDRAEVKSQTNSVVEQRAQTTGYTFEKGLKMAGVKKKK